jgi:2,3-dihydroxybenzoate-AMP ligase
MTATATATEDFRRWPEADQRRYRSAGYWRGETFGDLLRDWSRRYAGRTALVDVPDPDGAARRWTYAELDAQVDRVCAGLRGLGLRRGDRVILHLPNRAEFVLLWFALQRLGAVPVHAVPGHRRAEISHLAEMSGAVAYVAAEPGEGFAEQVRTDVLRHIIVVDGVAGHGHVSFADLARAEPDRESPPGPASSDLALLLLSGGTTGLPKLIPRTHDDYAYNARTYTQVCAMDADSVYLAVLPIAFNYTFACPGVLGALTVGGTAVLAPDPSPDTAFWLIEQERVTITAINPPLVPLWLDEFDLSRPDLSSLRVLQVGSARLADDVARRIEPALGVRLQQGYGMAEGLLNCTRLDDPDELVHTTQGRPISPADELRIVDPDTDEAVPEGHVGELLTRGPYTIRGYYRGGEVDDTSFTADGFYRTGDLVRQLGSGHLVVVGRVKDQINRGGEKIAATEVEGHLLANPAIRAAALVAAADPVWGEVPVAFLVCDAAPPTVGDIARFLADRGLAAYKAPVRVELVEELPLTPVGKIDKAALRARLR